MVPELMHLTRTSLWLELPVSTQRSPRERHRELTVLPRGPPRRSESAVVGANLGCLCEGSIFCPAQGSRTLGRRFAPEGALRTARCKGRTVLRLHFWGDWIVSLILLVFHYQMTCGLKVQGHRTWPFIVRRLL